MQDILGIGLENSGRTTFLTDSSILLHTKELAEYYTIYGRFPSISFVDDVFVHGRNINKLLHTLELHLVNVLVNNDDLYLKHEYKQADIELSLALATQIKVFVSYKKNRLLDYRYRDKLEAVIPDVTQAYWRDFSNKVSELITNSDVLNASFIYSTEISRPSQDILNSLIKTTYHGCNEYTDIRAVEDEKGIVAYATARIIENPRNGKMRLAPLVLLPVLSEFETNQLEEGIIRELNEQIISDWILQLKNTMGRRAYHEILVMIISTMYLFQIKKKYGLDFCEKDKFKEIFKLSRNYDSENSEENIHSILNIIIRKCHDCCEMMQDIIIHSIEKRGVVISNESSVDCFVHQLIPFWADSINDTNDFYKHARAVNEIYFYKKGWEEEHSAYEKKEEVFIYEDNEPRGESVFDMLRAIRNIYIQKKLDCDYYFKYNIVYILQMMDAGVLGIAIADREDYYEKRLFQYAKVGEQSQQLLPLKMCEYISFMKMVEERAESTRKTQKEELDYYFKNDNCDLTNDEQQKIYSFLDVLERAGQNPEDWDGYLFRKFAVICEDDSDKKKAENEKLHLVASDMRHKLNYLQNMLR